VLLGAVALGAAVGAAPDRVASAWRSAPVAVLGAIAALGGLSAAWTSGPADDALRWALVIAALAAIVVVAAALPDARVHGGILLAVTTGAALAGLIGAVGHVERLVLDVCGAWRPAGPLEYPPALALICAMGLPAAQVFATSGRSGPVRVAVLCGWILVTTLAVSGSRTGVGLAALTMLAVAVLHGGGAPAAGVLLAVSGGASALVLGGELGDEGAAALPALLPGVAAVVAAPRLLGRVAGGSPAVRRGLVAVLCLVGLVGVGAATLQERAGGCAYAGFGHGRSEIWRAAWRTAEQRPVFGSGLESFATVSRAQQVRVRAVPVQYAHALGLEAWVELGLLGAALVAALYVTVLRAALRATRVAAALLGPPAIAFLAANLLDWSWHLAGCGVLWAIAVGGLIGSSRRGPPRGGGRSQELGRGDVSPTARTSAA
jgi:O-antigen ligase